MMVARLRELAEKATSGPWELEGKSVFGDWTTDRGYVASREVAASEVPADAAYIAACDPATVTALMDVVEATRAYLPVADRTPEDVSTPEWRRARKALDAALGRLDS